MGDLYLRSWRASYEQLVDPAVLEPIAQARAAHDWVAAIGARTSHLGLGSVDGVPAGIVKIGSDPTETVDGMWLDLLYVVPEHWGTGVASELLTWALAQARGDRTTLVRLRVVEPQARARRFYEREGWEHDPDVPASRNEFFRLLCMRIVLG